MTDKDTPKRRTRIEDAENVLEVLDVIMGRLPWQDFPHPTKKGVLLPGRKTMAVSMLATRLALGTYII
jgi:hypothetical protein